MGTHTRRSISLASLFFIVSGTLVLLAAPPASALTFTPTKFTDSADGTCDADCSLREAIIAANTGGVVDTINLSAGTYSLTLTGDTGPGDGDLDINESVIINGVATIDQDVAGARVIEVGGDDLVTLNDVTVTGGTATHGAGIYVNAGPSSGVFGDLVLNGSTVTGNDGHEGGGVYLDQVNQSGARATITDSQFVDNDVTARAGAIYVDGNGTTAHSAKLIVNSSTFEDNNAVDDGGAIWNGHRSTTTVNSSTFETNGSGDTGGAFGSEGALVTINDSTIAGNTTGFGGAAVNHESAASDRGELRINRSTLSGNTADTSPGGTNGGAILNGGHAFINNSTISNNTADSGFGGGIFHRTGTLSIVSSTVSGNNAPTAGGVMVWSIDGTINLKSSILANNQQTDCSDSGTNFATSQGFNVIENNTGGCGTIASDATGVDPQLGGLAANGGPTLTHLPAGNSNAVNRHTNTDVDCAGVDQRGFGRVFNTHCDSGAVEVGAQPQVAVPNKLTDSADGSCDAADCSLREAVRNANVISGASTIALPDLGGPYELSLTGDPDESAAASGDLDIRDTLTVTGPATIKWADSVAASSRDRLFELADNQTATLERLTLTGGNVGGNGGAVRVNATGNMTLEDVTLSGNTAAEGGGLWNSNSSVNVLRSTIANNTGTTRGGGIKGNFGAINVKASILADNSSPIGPDCDAGTSFVSQGANVVEATNCQDSDPFESDVNADALNSTLADNGSRSLTHAITTASPAFDLLDNGDADCAGTDARGLPRPSAAGRECDAGAFELQTVSYRPDALIRRSSDATFTGDGIFNTDGTDQTLTKSVKRGKSATFVLKFENGFDADTVTIAGCANPKGFKVTYLEGPTDKTAEVQAGLLDVVLASEASYELTLKIKAKSRGPRRGECLTTVTGAASPDEDAVMAVAKAKG